MSTLIGEAHLHFPDNSALHEEMRQIWVQRMVNHWAKPGNIRRYFVKHEQQANVIKRLGLVTQGTHWVGTCRVLFTKVDKKRATVFINGKSYKNNRAGRYKLAIRGIYDECRVFGMAYQAALKKTRVPVISAAALTWVPLGLPPKDLSLIP